MEYITIIVKERTGVLKELGSALGAKKINIEDIHAAVVGDLGVITIGIKKKDHARAIKILQELGHKPVPTGSFIIRLENKPGELAKVADILASNGISILNIALIDKKGKEYILINTSKNDEAKKLLAEYVTEL